MLVPCLRISPGFTSRGFSLPSPSLGTFPVLHTYRSPSKRFKRMSWKDPSERHSDDLIAAIHAAAHRIETAITQGFKHMADAQTQALTDLQTAVTAVAAAITAAATALSNVQPNNSAAIETQVTALNTAAAQLNAAVNPPAPAPGP